MEKPSIDVATVIETSDGLTGLDLVRRQWHELRLLVLDVGVPTIDGRVICARIRDVDEELPILSYTAMGQAVYVLNAFGCLPLVLKPVRPRELARALRDALAQPTPPLKEARYWASSDVEADAAGLLAHIAARWDVEVLFGDGKELLGLDQYQLMSSRAIVRFWTLAMAAYAFLEDERERLRQLRQSHVTIGEARREVQQLHWCHLIGWMQQQFRMGQTPQALAERLAA